MKRHSSLRKPVMVHYCLGLIPFLTVAAFLMHAPAYSSADLLIDDVTATTVSCDYLIIAPPGFLECALRLAAHRNECRSDDVEQAKSVELHAIYSRFPAADTEPASHQIWYALKYAKTNWSEAPDYVVLLGDDSLDYNDGDSVPRSAGLMPAFYWGADTGRNWSGILEGEGVYPMSQPAH
jgi:hypothetical protein